MGEIKDGSEMYEPYSLYKDLDEQAGLPDEEFETRRVKRYQQWRDGFADTLNEGERENFLELMKREDEARGTYRVPEIYKDLEARFQAYMRDQQAK